jgi:hypothetical protein
MVIKIYSNIIFFNILFSFDVLVYNLGPIQSI